jgi:hypothetical protein
METLCAVTWQVLSRMLGRIATRAFFTRAVYEVAQQDQRLAGVRVVDGGFDAPSLERSLLGLSASDTREQIVALANQLVTMLRRLFGAVTVAILRDVETELGSSRSNSPGADAREEGP